MAAAYDSSVSLGSGSAVSSLTTNFNNVAGNALCVSAGRQWAGTTKVSTMTYNSVGLTLDRNTNYDSFYGDAGGHLFSPATGTNSLAITMTGTVDLLLADVVSVSGAGTSALDDFQANQNVSSTTNSVTVTSQTNGIVVAGLVAREFDTWTLSSPVTTVVQNMPGSDRVDMGWVAGSSSVTVNASVGLAAGDCTVMAWAFKPSGGGGGFTAKFRKTLGIGTRVGQRQLQ